MKKRFYIFSLLLFFATFCAALLVQKTQENTNPDNSLKNHFSQKSDDSGQGEIYTLADIQDNSDSGNFEKVKFDYSILEQQWLMYFFAQSFVYKPVAAVQNRIYISAPRYILYHSLQIAGC